MGAEFSRPWLDPEIARMQREMVDRQLQQDPMPQHFRAYAEAVRSTECPGSILEVGCGVGHGREILDRAGVEYGSYIGFDISHAAIALAKERYPESDWQAPVGQIEQADIVVDGSCLLHVDNWQTHLEALCKASRRWVILHRVPTNAETTGRVDTQGYGHTFPAWCFEGGELVAEMKAHGFEVGQILSTGESPLVNTITFAKPRHYVSYCDANFLPRLKVLYQSMLEHCAPFRLHVLAWDQGVSEWCAEAESVDCWHIDDYLDWHSELKKANLPGPPRTRIEHMWTVGPQFIADVMLERESVEPSSNGEPVTYLDADLMFHSSPEPVFAEIGGAAAAVNPHGFANASQGLPGPTAESHAGLFGAYNVGFIYVSDRGYAERWAEQCRDWCYDRVQRRMEKNPRAFENIFAGPEDITPNQRTGIERIRYADQKFLEDWVENGAHVIHYPGTCPGPWNIHTRSLDVRNGMIHFGNRPLVAFHYSSLKLHADGRFVASRPEYQVTNRQEEILYAPYLRALKEASK